MANPFADPNYKFPKKPGNYMQFEEGPNLFRMLAEPIAGYEYWTEDAEGRHPNRVENFDDLPEEHIEEAKHFWAFPVWNYKVNRVQILELTQKGIIEAILGFKLDEGWGSPLDYDIIVTKSGKELQTRYTVLPRPKKDLDSDIAAKWQTTTLDLEALYRGDDPFGSESQAPVAKQADMAKGHQFTGMKNLLKKLGRSEAEFETEIGKSLKSLTSSEASAHLKRLKDEVADLPESQAAPADDAQEFPA